MATITLFSVFALFIFEGKAGFGNRALAQASPTPVPAEFDQKEALAKLREQIKGKGKEPAGTIFKNLQTGLKGVPAGQLLAIMEIGYARSLGVNCTHCHVPNRWESDDKPQKQITRDMSAMSARINGELLKNIKNLSSTPTVNCTTCHRGQVIPALDLPSAPSRQ